MGYLDRKARIKFYEELKKAGKTKIQLQENLLKEEAEAIPVIVVTEEPVQQLPIDEPVVVDPAPLLDVGAPDSLPSETLGIADMLMNAINDEYETIASYNMIIANLNEAGYPDLAAVISHINEEEQIHVGMIQHALEKISEQAKKVEEGRVEAEQIISGEPAQEEVAEKPMQVEEAFITNEILEEAIDDEKLEDAQRLVDSAIKLFGRIGAGLYDELDAMGLYISDEDGKYIVKKKVPDSE